jgi:leader peptidase (prepilin peptidase)/N-methyltransferase
MKFGVSLQFLAAFAMTSALVAMSGIDIKVQLLPDSMTLPFLWLGLLISLIGGGLFVSPQNAIIGAALGYLSLWSVYHLFKLATGKEGMGYGDFKLLAMLGAWMGASMLPLIIILSALAGSVIGLGLILFQGRDKAIPLPFGPYLAIAGWIAFLWGDRIMGAYLSQF